MWYGLAVTLACLGIFFPDFLFPCEVLFPLVNEFKAQGREFAAGVDGRNDELA